MQKAGRELGLPLAFSYNLSPTIDGNEKTRNYQVSRVLCLACEFADHENKFLETTSETERQAEMARLNQCDTVYALQCGGQQFCGGLPRADAALHEAAGAWCTADATRLCGGMAGVCSLWAA